MTERSRQINKYEVVNGYQVVPDSHQFINAISNFEAAVELDNGWDSPGYQQVNPGEICFTAGAGPCYAGVILPRGGRPVIFHQLDLSMDPALKGLMALPGNRGVFGGAIDTLNPEMVYWMETQGVKYIAPKRPNSSFMVAVLSGALNLPGVGKLTNTIYCGYEPLPAKLFQN